jgi:predicted nucleic acid-binding protein
MNYLLVTNHWSHLQRGHPRVVARVQALSADTILYMSVVAQAELLLGVEQLPDGHRKEELRQLYEQTLRTATEILPVDSRAAERFALVFVQLKRAGRPIPTNDIWASAIALVHDLTVVTNDGHFRAVEGLRTEDWTQP